MLEESLKWRSTYKPEEIRWVSLMKYNQRGPLIVIAVPYPPYLISPSWWKMLDGWCSFEHNQLQIV